MYPHRKIHKTYLDNREAVEFSKKSPCGQRWVARALLVPFFLNNVNGELYLKFYKLTLYVSLVDSWIQMKPSSCKMEHIHTSPRNWLNENFPGRWIGRGGPQDCNITRPPRSPDMTPMDYILWGYIRIKMYVKNYVNISDLISTIISAFQ